MKNFKTMVWVGLMAAVMIGCSAATEPAPPKVQKIEVRALCDSVDRSGYNVSSGRDEC